jgi:hypothetical protein
MTDTKKVYVVINYCYETGNPVFKGVFFSKEAAQAFINAKGYGRGYNIEIYKESEEGTAEEIYED